MFGDILADAASLLLGSRGMSYSGNFSEEGYAVFQTGHGSAYDLMGKDTANPIGQLLSLSMMLKDFYKWDIGSNMIIQAIHKVLSKGIRTKDIASTSHKIVSTSEFVDCVIKEIQSQ
jgi:3-isopropylmalate dehydrogenase